MKANETFSEILKKSFIRVHIVLTLHLAGSSFKLNMWGKKTISLFKSSCPVARSKEETHVREGVTRAIGLWSLPGLDIVL